jgi:hypothetical protein
MTRALSQDLRSRVIAAVDGGLSRNAAAARDPRSLPSVHARTMRQLLHSDRL